MWGFTQQGFCCYRGFTLGLHFPKFSGPPGSETMLNAKTFLMCKNGTVLLITMPSLVQLGCIMLADDEKVGCLFFDCLLLELDFAI